jgi:thiosulfate/3-mercaptopyruvate sulfurtransferase
MRLPVRANGIIARKDSDMPSGYARPELLAETDWLAEHKDDPNLLIVDCDEQPAYLRLHIEGAIGLRTHHYFKGKDGINIMPPEEFEKVMSSHGIGNDTTVVTYDNMGGVYAARLWWALDYYGHTDCRVLNGGFRKWYEEGRPVTMDQPHVVRASFKARPAREDSICSLDDVKDAIARDDVVVWDVRSHDEHTGDDNRPNKRHGHIPGAVHLEWLDLTAPPVRSGLLLPADEIRTKLKAIGITPEKTILTH